MPSSKFLDLGSYFVICVTLVLFVVALFVKGLTHDLLLEVGVFLVSAKLVIASYKQSLMAEELRVELGKIRALLEPKASGAS